MCGGLEEPGLGWERKKFQLICEQPEKVGAGRFVCQQLFLEGVSRCP